MDAFALFLHTAMPVGTRASSIRDFAAIMVASPASRSALDPLSESGADFAAVPYAVGDAKRGQFISSGDRLCDAAFNCNFISRGSPRKLRCMPHCMGAKACTLAVLSCQSSDKTSVVDVFQSVAQLIPSRATSSLGRSSSVSNRAPLTRRRRYGSKVAAVHSRSHSAGSSGGGQSWCMHGQSSWVRPRCSAIAGSPAVARAPVGADAGVAKYLPFPAWGGDTGDTAKGAASNPTLVTGRLQVMWRQMQRHWRQFAADVAAGAAGSWCC